ncbi:DUF805 domain-containing protein [Bradyrhizobium sp.]|uniref:DUF805 domain-containing protein n=1 Tax=Bradyrhizobium sp. TaxID=376 RepID=UPI002D3D2421|nr:DUF805 domain-containing protein [Bradyrhizobium sp.]HZR73161.1 DUF805 domain-containing protein [Bradyrhizobium sp.]
MDWVWFLFEFDGRINRAKMWLAMLVIVCWMAFLAMLILFVDQLFGNPVKSIHFNVNDIFKFVDPAVLRNAIARVREGKEASPAHLVLAFCHAAGTLIFAWVYLATAVKRLHDRDKSGWWALPYLVVPGLYTQFQDRLPDADWLLPLPWAGVLLMIAGFVELFCLRGTRWTNRFGPNPLPKAQTRPRSSSGGSSSWNQTDAIEFVPHQASPLPGMRVKRGHD